MNEQTTNNPQSKSLKINLNYRKIKKAFSIALLVIGYLTTLGLTFTGIGLMTFSLLSWTLFNTLGLSVLTMIMGFITISISAVLFIGKVSKDGDAMLRRLPMKNSA